MAALQQPKASRCSRSRAPPARNAATGESQLFNTKNCKFTAEMNQPLFENTENSIYLAGNLWTADKFIQRSHKRKSTFAA
jgi:hypothetical protein